MKKIGVAILGATGTVGQKFISLLGDHPYFDINEVVASGRSAGRSYREATRWYGETELPHDVGEKVVKSTSDKLESQIVLSGMDSKYAGEVEEEYARRGHYVITNASNHRMDPLVPLIIPEINSDHLALIDSQPYDGGIIANSNCSTMFMAMVLFPLYRDFGIETVQVSTMQAVSGAGYSGVPSMEILGNIVPYIPGEEEKMECESQKILGTLEGNRIVAADYTVSAQCNRVPVFDGHTETLSIRFSDRGKRKPTVEEVVASLRGFKGYPQEAGLPFAPESPVVVVDEPNRPQPYKDVNKNRGMSTFVGRVRSDSVADIKMVVLGHNTVRGAAGATILNAECLVQDRFV